MRGNEFVHLHLHTDYSLLDGACSIQRLAELAARQQMRAVAVTDHGNLFAAVKFYEAARAHGVKPILGCEIYVARGSHRERSGNGERAYHLLVLCESGEGYRNLVKLVTTGHLDGFYYKPRVDKELLARYHRGLIATSACLNGEVAQRLLAGDYPGARQAASEYRDIFGQDNFFLEIQSHGLELENRIHADLGRLARDLDIPLVATNDCHYLYPEDQGAHDVLLCIQTGKTLSDPNRMRFGSDQFYFKSAQEMARVFAAVPEAVERTVAIAERCQVQLTKVDHPFPYFAVPEGYTLESYFEKVTREGFERRRPRLAALATQGRLPHALSAYEQRLQQELRMIQELHFADYFLIVWDFIRYAREQGIPVGPGRGSAAGSLVGYALGITDIDPLQYGLLFERFLNPERVSLPDIDIDFCMRRRGEVINYVTQKYGRENVAQIITFGTLAAKAALKDTARAMEVPYAEADRLAKLIPPALNITLEQALQSSPALKQAYEREEKLKRVIDIARKLEGLARHASTHAAGVVISPQPLQQVVPLYKTNREEIVTQFAMDDLERIGLLKMDFLGLTTLTVIDDTVKLIEQNRGRRFDLSEIPLDDPQTYQLFSRGATSGIFQFESHGMREILRRYQPARFEDLIALNALHRPGPIQGGMIDDFIARKHGRKQVTYELPELKPILGETYGVIVYQEQVMQIANQLAGFRLSEGDLLRRAMGKKKRKEMAAQREKFIAGCQQRRISQKKAARLFDLMAQFAGYGFNKSHSAAYALLAYQTAYLKTHHPVEFMAALLTAETGNTEKIVRYIGESREMSITVLPPDVNTSDWSFTPSGQSLRFGLGAVRNVGYNTVQAVKEARERVRQFHSLFQFCEEVDLRVLNRRVLESLVKAGAMDSLGAHRAQLLEVVDRALERGARLQREKESGQHALFGGAGMQPAPPPPLPEVEEWPEHERLTFEKEMLGFYTTGHPLARYEGRLRELATTPLAELETRRNNEAVRLAGILIRVRPMRSKKGDRWAIATLEDLSGVVDLLVFPEAFRRLESRLYPDAVLLLKGRVRAEDAGVRVAVQEAKPLEEALPAAPAAPRVVIRLDVARMSVETINRLEALFRRKPGRSRVEFKLPPELGVHRGGRDVRVNVDEEFLAEVKGLCGETSISLLQ
ncbi:DNA polymerase III subunit alpha [Acidobacteriia bacterium AH_259_A11_L15]|nr:DNA polymerase III subunit alpha [Acidobacteriia bacterium AH_259_A11_L15]